MTWPGSHNRSVARSRIPCSAGHVTKQSPMGVKKPSEGTEGWRLGETWPGLLRAGPSPWSTRTGVQGGDDYNLRAAGGPSSLQNQDQEPRGAGTHPLLSPGGQSAYNDETS